MRNALIAVILFAMMMGSSDNPNDKFGCNSNIERASRKRLSDVGSLMNNQPAPVLKFSVERDVLIKRMARETDPNKVWFLYLCSPVTGQPIYKVMIKGKVVSSTKRLNPDQSVDYNSSHEYLQNAPDEFGTWGQGTPKNFCISVEDILVEFSGFPFIYSEKPLRFNSPVLELEQVEK